MPGTKITRAEWIRLVSLVVLLKVGFVLVMFYGWRFLPVADYSSEGSEGVDVWMTRPETTFFQNLANFDGAWYIRLAALGYKKIANGDYDLEGETKRLKVMDELGFRDGVDRKYGYRHWPLLGWTIRLFQIPLRSFLLAGVVASNLCYFIYAGFLYALVRLDFEPRVALIAVLFASIHPGAYSLTGVFNESMFLVFAAAAIYFARRESWLISGIMGMGACLARIDGIFLLAPLGYEFIRRTYNSDPGPAPVREVLGKKNILDSLKGLITRPGVWWLVLVPAGMGIVLFTFHRASGNPFVFFDVHEANIHGHISWPWNMLAETFHKGWHVWMKELPLHGLLFLIILGSLRGLRRSYVLWMILFFIYQASNGNHSYLRYQVQCLPMFIALARLSDRYPGLQMVYTFISAGLAALFGVMFINAYWVA
jgi:hypothetical protein